MKFLHETPWYGWLLFVLSVAAGVLLVGVFYRADEKSDENAKARVALCALRVDLDKRIEVSQNLLDQNPGKRRIAGFDRSVIEMSVSNSRRTREALNVLDCEEA